MNVKNVAFYKFIELKGLLELRPELKQQAQGIDLRGTLILAPEGINGFLAGGPAEIDQYLDLLTQKVGNLQVKQSYSQNQPFQRMKVKIKKEIIPFGLPEIQPQRATGTRLEPAEFKRWLDEGRPVWIVDTRNDYEVKLGSFENALNLEIQKFKDFPKAWSKIAPELKDRPVVMFCTGGIRCEKATAFAVQSGHPDVYQLEGGILQYFEKCQKSHYSGDCFVFDERTALDPDLNPLSEPQRSQCRREHRSHPL